jgi:hypothetical protein
MLNLDDLPRDANGMIQGAWRILHEDPSFAGTIGAFDLRDGESVEPAYGRRLAFVALEQGANIYLEAWGDVGSFYLPEWIQAEVPAEWSERLQVCPRRAVDVAAAAPEPTEPTEADEPEPEVTVEPDPDPTPDDLDAMTVEDLRALAALHDVAVDGRWREPKLRDALRSAGITG